MNIGLIRGGKNDHSINETPICSYTGENFATVTIAGIETVRWDIKKNGSPPNLYRRMELEEIISIFDRAGKLFAEGEVQMGSSLVGPQEYARLFSLSTGAPVCCPINTLQRVKQNFSTIQNILAFQAVDGEVEAYSKGYVNHNSKPLGWVPIGRNLLVVTPSNHPAVNLLWAIGLAMGYPITIRPSLDDPFTPLRILSALLKAGMPEKYISFYPTPHTAVSEMVSLYDRTLIFGNEQLVKQYVNHTSVKMFGPGRSIIVVGNDYADRVDDVVNLCVESMMKDGGRGCINLSTIIAQKNGEEIAEGIAEKISLIDIYDPIDQRAELGAFKDKNIAIAINEQIEEGLQREDIDITLKYRESPRLVQSFDTTFLMPSIVLCKNRNRSSSPLFGKEYPFPFVTLTEEKEVDKIVSLAENALTVTLLSDNRALIDKLLFCPGISKLYHGFVATNSIDFENPHEGFLSDFLFKAKALKKEAGYGSFV